MINEKLIIILGFYTGGRLVDRYLNNGYKIIGVEASESTYRKSLEKYNNKEVQLINKCIYKVDDEVIPFYESNNHNDWNSIYEGITGREGIVKKFEVNTITLPTLIKEYGCPIYLLIDIEGADGIALESLLKTDYRPKFISCETECLGKDTRDCNIDDALNNIKLLKQLGYKKFKLIPQSSNDNNFYLDFSNIYDDWNSYEEICDFILKKRTEHFKRSRIYYSFWYDVFATF